MEENGRNAWNEQRFRRAITKAGGVVSCSWGVAGLRDKKTGKMQAVIIFHDDDKEAFSFAFSFGSKEEVMFLCKDLTTLQAKIDAKEFGGENETT